MAEDQKKPEALKDETLDDAVGGATTESGDTSVRKAGKEQQEYLKSGSAD